MFKRGGLYRRNVTLDYDRMSMKMVQIRIFNMLNI